MAARKANPERGEHELTLAGVRYVLRPSYAAMVEIERETGRSYMELAGAGLRGSLSIQHLGQIAGAMIRAGAADGDLNANVSDERIGEMVFEEGIAPACKVVTEALVESLGGGRTAAGEAKAAAASGKKAPATAA